ncbi:hypothetical protein [Frigoriglobus tundricola]|nr:hypothetical protein [Frigoriglobus tundricola]
MAPQPGGATRAARSSAREWRWGWAAVLLMNLPVALLFGFFVTSRSGAFGMLAGVFVVWLAGHFAVARFARVRGALIVGGICVAVLQVIPLLQIGAGLSAVALLADRAMEISAAAAFAVTLMTGGQLIVAALVAGYLIRSTRPVG